MDNWNDDRLDELSRRVDGGFTKVDERFVRFEGEMKAGFAKVDERFEKVEDEIKVGFAKTGAKEELGEVKAELKSEIGEISAGIRQLNERFDRLLNTLTTICLSFWIAGSGIAACIIVARA